ncbi:hypothetical protein [Streptomyces sp. 8P21H-1]|uniref:hypothetical protein n=1 Tax=Streptomyces sp. 8P21H-1 TaxID=2737048 RepID=UPI00156E8871|nr:hypothetical protein [Streptomyces sp. 8P21H-1]NSL42871.1 hypothetical protein [Streptomyces sp. 8P21H-1]
MSAARNILMALAAAGAAVTLTAAPAAAAPGDTLSICHSQLTPSGWADVSWSSSSQCGGFEPNRKQIKQLDGYPIGTEVAICASTLQPAGWIQIREYYSQSCRYSSVPSLNNNAWTVRRVS